MDLEAVLDPQNLYSSKDLVVVITGGGTGIGLAFATALYKTGARKLYLLGRRTEPLEKAAKTLHESNNASSSLPVVIPVQCDVSSQSSINEAATKIEKEVGYIDVLINNAGVGGPDHRGVHNAQSVKELQDILLNDIEGFATTYAINSTSVVGVSAAFLGLLDKGNERRGWETGVIKDRARERNIQKAASEGIDKNDARKSQIITVTSIAGLNRYVTMGISYSSSKAAATHTGKMLAHLLAPWGIRSNMIAPGLFPSEMTEGLASQFPPDKIPLGHPGQVEDLAGLILYLVGRGGSYVNGSVQLVDGGRLSVMPSTT